MPNICTKYATDAQISAAWTMACQLVGADPALRFAPKKPGPGEPHVKARYVAAAGIFRAIKRVNRSDVVLRLGFGGPRDWVNVDAAPKRSWWRYDFVAAVASVLIDDQPVPVAPKLRKPISRVVRRKHGVELPRWVPDDLRHDYFDVADLMGEEAAASHCRKLKREMAEARHA